LSWAIAEDLIEQGGELLLQAASWNGGVGRAGGGLVSEPGSDFQSFASVGEAELVQVVRVHIFEKVLGGIEEGFGQDVLAVAEGFGAGRGIEAVFAIDDTFDFGSLLDELGGAGFDAAAPIEITGPAFDGAEGDADFAADGSVTTTGTELPVRAEGFEGAVGFAAGLREVEVG